MKKTRRYTRTDKDGTIWLKLCPRCSNCGSTQTYFLFRTGEVRCRRCGHTIPAEEMPGYELVDENGNEET